MPSFAFSRQPILPLKSEGGFVGQLTWTRLSQELKNSPTFFDETLSVDLLTFQQSYLESTLLQHVDGLLTASETEEECKKACQRYHRL